MDSKILQREHDLEPVGVEDEIPDEFALDEQADYTD